MFKRDIEIELENWLKMPNRKPMVLRGARQVGKTTVVRKFAKQFDNYLYFNLELSEDKQPFEEFTTIENLIQTLFFIKNKTLINKNKTLIFIDEIQEVTEAFNLLRYFYENEPNIPIIAAGSMLETLFNKDIHFPVGRVHYKVLRPVSFPEFLGAMGEISSLIQLKSNKVSKFAHIKLLNFYHIYALIGGMPEVVENYVLNKDINALSPIFDSLITSYLDDVEKYAKNDSQTLHIRHVIKSAFLLAGKRIKFEGFGNSSYKSREMGEALRTLEKALLLHLIYPCTSALLPLIPDIKKSPRLQVLDTGMMNYFVGLQRDIFGTKDLNEIYQGTIIEHLTGQELLANESSSLGSINFWVREKKESTAEVDFVYSYQGKLIPIEVKSGKEGSLRSLHQYMDLAPHDLAVRFYAGEIRISEGYSASGKKYRLLNLPYYLVSQIDNYLEWFESGEK